MEVCISYRKSCLVHHARVTRQTHRHDYDLTWFESSYPTIPMHCPGELLAEQPLRQRNREFVVGLAEHLCPFER